MAKALAAGALLAAALSTLQGAEPAATAVLDTLSVWRMHSELAPPILATGAKAKLGYTWMNYETPVVGPAWTGAEFDDRFWHRGPVTMMPKTALLARACLRGKFTVAEIGAMKALKLSAAFHGGLIVYVNGKEVYRAHIPKGKLLAEGDGGEDRSVTDVPIPLEALRQGPNVLALEVIRGAYPQKGPDPGEDMYSVNTCEISRVRLSAASAAGIKPNIARPAGLQAWPADPLAVDFNLDYGDEAEGPRPVTIIGARNGMFTGKVLVGSSRAIRGVKATAGDLTGPGGRIPAAAVEIRYGVEWNAQAVRENTRFNELHPYVAYEATQFNALSPEAPEEAAPKPLKTAWYRGVTLPETVKPIPGALVPVWLSVHVPADVKGGTFTGSVKLEAQGEKPFEIPVEVRVADYMLPATQNFRTWVDIIQCPDTLALEYNVPLWSEKHWDLIARSFKLIGETGCRIVYVPLLAHTDLGNEESMVRWVKQGENKYSYDFSIMEKYLDVAEKAMGKPKLIVFVAWEVYMLPKSAGAIPDAEAHGRNFRLKDEAQRLEKSGAAYGIGPLVTVLDGPAKKPEVGHLPPYSDAAASAPLWRPLFDELHKRLVKRGMDGIAMLGLIPDAWPTKQDVQFLKDVSGNMPWVIQSHGIPTTKSGLFYDLAPVGYQAVVWNAVFSDDGADVHGNGKGLTTSLHGWNQNVLFSGFERWSRENHPCARWLTQPEVCITGKQRGPGRLGGDYWKVIKDKKGQRSARVYEQYAESNWGNLAIPEALLAPGTAGALATNQMEALREGVQECEARIAIEQALIDAKLKVKLGAELAQRCEEYLNAREMMMWLSLSNLQFYQYILGSSGRPDSMCAARGWRSWPDVTGQYWLLSSGYQERNAQLYALAGEVAKKLGEVR